MRMNRLAIACMLGIALSCSLLTGCKKWDDVGHWPHGKQDDPADFSSQVIEKWMSLQLRLMRNATGIPNHGFSRQYVYAGIAAWESIAPGMPGSQQLNKKWNGLSNLPQAGNNPKHYWPANANAALAAINRSLFPNATAADKTAIDSLENALLESFRNKAPNSRLQTSIQFGKAVAASVYNWAETDGYKKANDPYTPPVGPGLWKPTPPTNGAAATPYWGNNRPVVKNSLWNTTPAAPPAYSTDPNSVFYKMVKQVHDVYQTLTTDQKNMATYWRDIPGVSSPGHWLSILLQTIRKTKTSLPKAALAYALTGAAANDALIGCFAVKYKVNLVRPITYIRETIGYGDWNAFINTPAHPEFPSAHSALSGGVARVIETLFKNVHQITDHTYDYMGLSPRTYSSFTAIAEEAGVSRLYGGIHYQHSIDAGLQQGFKTGANILDQCLPANGKLD